jgi:DNA-binding CsgD family transcriptional regulator/PAS domain-containing protein
MADRYDGIIGLIYEGIGDDAHWDSAVAQVARRLSAAGVGLGMQDMKTHAFRGLTDYGVDPNLIPTYRRLAPTNKIWMEISRRRQPLTDQMVMTKRTFKRTELYADWFMPQEFHGVMAFPVLFKESLSAVVVAFRNRKRIDFESADLAQLGRFAHHFGQALSIRLDRERTAADLMAANLMLDAIRDAILLVDRDLRLQHANRAGRAMLDESKVVRLRRGRLEIRDAKANALIAKMVSGARGGELPLFKHGPAQWVIQVHPCPDGVGHSGTGRMVVKIISLNQHSEPPTPARLRERLGLTLRQSEVIVELARGGTEAKAARNLGIGEPTVHEHIRRVYDSLELGSRAELFALLARHGFDTISRHRDL